MCVFKSPKVAKPEDPKLPIEYAAQREPDAQTVNGAGRRTRDRLRAATSTMLTGDRARRTSVRPRSLSADH